MEERTEDDFKMKEEVGWSNNAIVYKAYDKKFNVLVAIKKPSGKLELVKKEGEVLMKCNSDYIVRYKGLIKKEKETWVIVMEYCHGGSLKSFIVDGNTLTVDELRDVTSCCLFGLLYLQEKMVIHGDIKPSNLLISQDGKIKLADFGLAEQLNHSNSVRRMEGATLWYKAPEVFKGKSVMKSDVWSLGITLIELADGKNPYEGINTKAAIINRITKGEPPSITNPNMPGEFVNFVKRCLVKDVEKRSSVGELMEDPFVKDSIERILNNGNSTVILKLAERINASASSTSSGTWANVYPETEYNTKSPSKSASETAVIKGITDFPTVEGTVSVIVVFSNCCNEKELNSLVDLSQYVNLRELLVGDNCFMYVEEVKLIGLHQLESVVVGKNCFTKKKSSYGSDPNRHFYLKDCERMRELKMGCYSFSDYTICEIANVNSLEKIEMGEMNEVSYNFCCASLELKDLPEFKSLQIGYYSFYYCHRVLFENLPELTSIRLGYYAFRFDDDESSQLTMRNLPKLTTLTTEGGWSSSFRYPHHIVLENMPSLQTVTLPRAFKYRNVKTENINEQCLGITEGGYCTIL